MGGGIGTIVLVVIYLFLGGKSDKIPKSFQGGQQNQTASVQTLNPAQKQLGEFVSVVLADTEDVWHKLFRKEGLKYREPRLT